MACDDTIDVRECTDAEVERIHDVAAGSGRPVAFIAALVDGIGVDLVLIEQHGGRN